MDNNAQDQYIQKKLLYKFDKKLDTIEQQYFKQMFPSSDNPRKFTNQELIQDITGLQFLNFKYRTALLSSNTDLTNNSRELIAEQQKIQNQRVQIKKLQQQLQRAQKAKENKKKYNEIGQQIMRYDTRDVFGEKLGSLDSQIRQLQQRYSRDMKTYDNRQRLLKTSIAALKSFLKDVEQKSKGNQIQQTLFRTLNAGQLGEDDGQIY